MICRIFSDYNRIELELKQWKEQENFKDLKDNTILIGSFFLFDAHLKTSLVAQRLKRLPAMQETWVQSLGQEDPLEKEMATHSSIFAWRIPWTEEPIRLQSMGSQSWTRLSDFTFTLKFTSLYEGFSDCLFKVSSPVNFII